MATGTHKLTPSGNRKKVEIEEIAQWIKESWDELDPSIIQRGFKKCCLTNAMDGSEDDLVYGDRVASRDPVEEELDEEDVLNDALYNDQPMDGEGIEYMFDSDDSDSDDPTTGEGYPPINHMFDSDQDSDSSFDGF